jgi:hypothetical protein
MDEQKVGNGVSRVDKRTKAYRDSIKAFEDAVEVKGASGLPLTQTETNGIGGPIDIDYGRCSDPHGLGCRGIVKTPAVGIRQPCDSCVWYKDKENNNGRDKDGQCGHL